MGLFRKRLDADELARLKDELASLKEQLARNENATTDLAARIGSVDTVNTRLAEHVHVVGDLNQRVVALDARMTAVSTELANQLNELGNDIDTLASPPHANGNGAGTLTELRDGQVRLANEQARYQIAFRDDLARLAEQLRRTSA